jgi:DNA-binding winged helix-turn-helix (wHTH) protein
MPGVSYRFDRFIVDCDTRQLLRDGSELHLSPKAFDLLVFLLVKRPRAVSKTEMLEHLWPSTFVEETNLASLVAEIRRALGDRATTPAFVRTVYRFGYRFVGEVEKRDAPVHVPAGGPRPYLVFEQHHTMLLEGSNVIGRAPDAAVQCDVTGVSRHHARIVLANGTATLEDLDSKNGTHLNNKRVTSAPLSDGDEIRLGKATLVFRVGAAPGATETVGTGV